jgi:uncharacterized membrane protein
MLSVKTVLAGLLTYVSLDMLWLGLAAKAFYKDQLGTLARRAGETLAPSWPAVATVYVLAVIGLALFVLPKAADAPVWQTAAWGALFGLIVYGVYDLTNYGILAGWTFRLTLVDMAWGMIVCAASAAVMRLLAT